MCTNAAMGTDDIKNFNIKDGRSFVITQSIKNLNNDLQKFALDQNGWRILGNITNIYNLVYALFISKIKLLIALKIRDWEFLLLKKCQT